MAISSSGSRIFFKIENAKGLIYILQYGVCSLIKLEACYQEQRPFFSVLPHYASRCLVVQLNYFHCTIYNHMFKSILLLKNTSSSVTRIKKGKSKQYEPSKV